MTKKTTIEDMKKNDALVVTDENIYALVFLAESKDDVDKTPFAVFADEITFRLAMPLIKSVAKRLNKHMVVAGTEKAGKNFTAEPTVGDMMWIAGMPEELIHKMPGANEVFDTDKAIGITDHLKKMADDKDPDDSEYIVPKDVDSAVKVAISTTENVDNDEQVIRALEATISEIRKKGYIDNDDRETVTIVKPDGDDDDLKTPIFH